MYYPFFLTYILTGLIIAIIVFAWALKNDQFSEQQRARYLALEKNRGAGLPSKKNKLEMVAIMIVVIAGILTSFAAVGYAIITQWK